MSKAKPVLNQLNIVAKDFEKTLEFYRKLGVDISNEVNPQNGIQHAAITFPNGFRIEFDNNKLAELYNAAWRKPKGSVRTLIGFSLPTSEEVDKRYNELVKEGFEGIQPPFDAFWGARYAIVKDPDGNDVGLMSPIDEERKTWPPIPSPAR